MEFKNIFFFFYLLIAFVGASPVPENRENDINSLVKDTLTDMTNEALNNVSVIIKNSLEEQLSKQNSTYPNDEINKAIMDILEQNEEGIKKAVGDVVKREIEHLDLGKAASEGAHNINMLFNNKILPAINDLFNNNKNFDQMIKKAFQDATHNVQNFIQKSLETTKAVIDQSLTNGFNTILSSTDDDDISSIVTNGISYIIKNTLCQSLGDDFDDVCENITNSIIISTSGILNDIIRTSIVTASGNSIAVACAIIPNEIFKNLSSIIVNAISTQISHMTPDPEMTRRMSNGIVRIISNSVEHLLCGKKAKIDNKGNANFNNVDDLKSSISNNVNTISNDAVLILNDDVGKKEIKYDVSETIANDVTNVQNALKGNVEEKTNTPAIKVPSGAKSVDINEIIDKDTFQKLIDFGTEQAKKNGGSGSIPIPVATFQSVDTVNFNPIVFYFQINKDNNEKKVLEE